MDLKEKERIEIEFWKNNKSENPSSFTLGNFLNKINQISILHSKISKYKEHFDGIHACLELGAGQGWASSFIKRWIAPQAKMIVTDISPYAVESVKYWEALYDIKVDKALACKSYELPFEDESIDLVFCFAAAHHFVKLEETLTEVKRVLKPSGKCLFLYEPTSHRITYKLHLSYVNSTNPSTPEDILIPNEIKKMGSSLNFKVEHYYDHSSQNPKSLVMGMYFKFISTFSFLQKILPSSSDFIFIKQ